MDAPEGNDLKRETVTATRTSTTAPAGAAPLPSEGFALPVVDPACYAIHGEIARGGVGRIIAASDRRLERPVALKQLHDPARHRARFVREAVLTARLQHPAIIPVHEVAQFPTGEPFIAMKLVQGRSLREAIAERPQFDQRLALLPSVLAVADALAYAHNQRIIHRDLKPANVLLGAFGETVVIDWGLAKQLDAPAGDVSLDGTAEVGAVGETMAGAVLGTPAYMPPEQARGEAVDERADVYSLGALMYHVLAGKPPYEGDGRAVLEQVATTPPPALASVAPAVAGDLARIVDKAMARAAAERYAHAGELADDLRKYLLGQPLGSGGGDPEEDPAIEAAFREELRRQTVRPLRLVCLLMVVLLPLFGVVLRFSTVGVQPVLLGARVVVVALAVAIYFLGRTRRGQRWSQGLAVAVIVLVAGLTIVGNLVTHGAIAGPSTAGFVLVLLTGPILFPLTPRLTFGLLTALTIGYLAVSARFGGGWAWGLAAEAMNFIAAVVVGTLAVRLAHRLRRSEFYNRYRLEDANRRLARLEHR